MSVHYDRISSPSVSGSIALFAILAWGVLPPLLDGPEAVYQSKYFLALSVPLAIFTWRSVLTGYSLSNAIADLDEELTLPAKEWLEIVVGSLVMLMLYTGFVVGLVMILLLMLSKAFNFFLYRIDFGFWAVGIEFALILLSKLGILDRLQAWFYRVR